jgi:hypothetical protein
MAMRRQVDLAWSVPGWLNRQAVPHILRSALDNHNIAHSGPEFEMKHLPSPVPVGEVKRATNPGLEFDVNWKKALVREV